jgi:Arc/MetJ family transcription regulator
MSRTNIDIDDDLIADVMQRFGFKSKREAVNYALRAVHVEPMTREQMLELEGIGWEGDLDAMRGRASVDSAAS